MTEPSLNQHAKVISEALAQLAKVNAGRNAPLHLGVALLRFKPASPAGSESQKLELAALEERLAASLRNRDVLLRVDTSSFGIVLKGLQSPEHMELAANKLKRQLKRPIAVLDQPLPVRFNAGLVLSERSDRSNALIQRAVNALMHATQEGLSISTDGHPDTEDQSTAALEEALANALTQGEFVPYFQPKVSAAYRSIVGVEALTRWHSRERGVVGPDGFMETLERSELIEPFTHRLLRTVLGHAIHWDASLTVSVNVPASLFKDDALVVAVQDALELFAFEPKRLILEVTESALIKDFEACVRQLITLRKLGIGISIDDFGTGYSSLAYLRELPASEVKIDRSFLAGIERRKRSRALVYGIIQLAHAMGLRVVTEGVENDAMADLLTKLGSDQLQGYRYGKPLEAGAFQAWLARKTGAA